MLKKQTLQNPLAGKPASLGELINIPKLITAYYTENPNLSLASERVCFGTSGHRGCSLLKTFNERHILAITQAICLYRKEVGNGPLFIGMDTHALSIPAQATAMEVLAANQVEVFFGGVDEYTPTPAISYAIINYNRGRKNQLADGIVITPSHNPPRDGGFKYSSSGGGPAETHITSWIEKKANELLAENLTSVKRLSFAQAVSAQTTRSFDYRKNYIAAVGSCIDMKKISKAKVKIGVDPLGGAGIHYWKPIADLYHLDITITNQRVDPLFSFMTLDWDGQIRTDPSSLYAMQKLISIKDQFDIAFACDADHDRHGIVCRSVGLMPPNHYLSVAIAYLLEHRPKWKENIAIGKTIVSTALIDRIARKWNKTVYEVPVGFKWYVEGLLNGTLGFGGEESAGASFLRLDGSVWTTDKDGIIPSLLAAEIVATTGMDPGKLYEKLTRELGEPVYDRIEIAASFEQKEKLKRLTPQNVKVDRVGGEKILSILIKAPGNNAPIGGIKVITENGWFVVRPSGTEDLYKIYAESFLGKDHLQMLLEEAQAIANTSIN